jgi:hypothetical protein
MYMPQRRNGNGNMITKDQFNKCNDNYRNIELLRRILTNNGAYVGVDFAIDDKYGLSEGIVERLNDHLNREVKVAIQNLISILQGEIEEYVVDAGANDAWVKSGYDVSLDPT